MKRSFASILLIGLTVLSVASMMSSRVQAQSETIVFTAQLLAANEAPPVAVAPSEANANGFATVTMEVTRTGGVITAASSRFDFSLSGMASNSVIILAHIHEGAAGVNGPIRVDSNLSPASPLPTSFGAAAFSRSGLATTPAIAQAIINNPSGFYFNVHTTLSPGGVARGQLVRQQQTTGIGAPTLSEWGAILMTLLIIAACTFFMMGRTRMATALAGAEAHAPISDAAKSIDWKLLARVAIFTEAAIALALVLLAAGAVDVMGALASGLLAAFIIHLFIANARRRL